MLIRVHIEATIVESNTSGSNIGKYRIISELGRGGMGIVYLAEDSTLRRSVALKVIASTVTGQPGFLTRFRGEAQLLASIAHPSVVRVHAFEVLDEQIVIDMEYCEGGALSEKLEAEALPCEQVLQVFTQIGGALGACHDAGMVHRDIKPANILFDARSQARLADFGIAAAYTDLLEGAFQSGGSTGMLWGTPRYAPPEAWDGAAPAPTWDIFSLGVVLYEAATCKHPFEAKNPLTLLKRINQADFVPLHLAAPGLPTWLCNLVSDMLDADPLKRPPDAMALLARVPDGTAELLPSPLPDMSRKRRWQINRHGRWTGFAPKLLLLIASALLLSTFVFNSLTSSSQPQIADFGGHVPSAEQLRILWKDSTQGTIVLSATPLTPESCGPSQWLLRKSQGDAWEAFIAGQFFLGHLGFSPCEDGSLRVEGQWASHPENDPLYLDLGNITGTAVWLEPQKRILSHLNFRSDIDGKRWECSLLAVVENMTDTAFLLDFEREPLLQPLLFNELQDMNLAWVGTTIELLPAAVSGLLRPASVDDPLVLDGILTDSAWRQAEQQTLEAFPRRSESTIRMSLNNEGLALGIKSEALTREDALLRVVVCRRFMVPISASPKVDTRIGSAGIVEILAIQGAETTRSEEKWTAKISRHDGSAEVLVPLELDAVDRSNFCRLNVSISYGDPDPPDVVWGYPDPRSTEHGVLVDLRDE